METGVVTLARKGELQTTQEDFLQSLRGMLGVGYRPQNYLLVRFTDDRTKATTVDDERVARETLTALRNEHGPARYALFLAVTGDALEPTLQVRDLAAAGAPVVRQNAYLRAGTLSFDTPTWDLGEAAHSRDCKNSAIFLGSFGITTGWLPNVDSNFSPPGVSSSPVW